MTSRDLPPPTLTQPYERLQVGSGASNNDASWTCPTELTRFAISRFVPHGNAQ